MDMMQKIFNPEFIEEFVSKELMTTYELNVELPIYDDTHEAEEFLKALDTVIRYYTTKDRYDAWKEDLEVDAEYRNFVDDKDESK